MKILWFTNTPALGEEYLKQKSVGGGWLRSLDKALQNKVDLHIAFLYPRPCKRFSYGHTSYYPVFSKNWKITWLVEALTNHLNNKEFEESYINLVNEIKPDIIHIHGTENSFSNIIDKVNIPVIVSLQGITTVISHKYCSGIESKYLNINRRSIKNGLVKFLSYRSFKSVYKRINKIASSEEKNLKKCKYIIGRTDWDMRISRILAPKSIYFHNDEILRDRFYEKKWEKPEKGKLVIHTTNGNSFIKGFETICYTVTLLNNIGVNIEWRVAGIGEKDLILKVVKKKLKEIFPERGLVLLGSLDEEMLIAKMLEADIYVNASHIENSPNNLCEAIILGMPCIASFAGGTGSLIKDGINGILIQDGDPWALAGAILELYSNDSVAKKYGESARESALKRHSPDHIVNSLLNIYSEITKREYVHLYK